MNHSKLFLQNHMTQLKQLASELLDDAEDILRIDNHAYQNFLVTLPCMTTETFKTNGQVSEAALLLFFGVVNYCFIYPQDYIYNSAQQGHLKRSHAFYHALQSFPITWEDFAAVTLLSDEDWQHHITARSVTLIYQNEIRCNRLRQFARFLQSQGLNHIESLIHQEMHAGYLLELLIDSGLFVDAFLKRAQATITALYRWAIRANKSIEGIEQLTLMADYRLPQLFYNSGVIRIVDKTLLQDLRAAHPLVADSRVENALRAAVIVLGERLVRDTGQSAYQLDKVLWEYTQLLLENKEMMIPAPIIPTDKF